MGSREDLQSNKPPVKAVSTVVKSPISVLGAGLQVTSDPWEADAGWESESYIGIHSVEGTEIELGGGGTERPPQSGRVSYGE